MLILSRKQNQKIRIGNDIIIKVISIADNNVKIGIEANENIKILREEIYESIKYQTMQAADMTKATLPTNIESFKLNKIKNAKEN